MRVFVLIALIAIGLTGCSDVASSGSASSNAPHPTATPRTAWGRAKATIRKEFGKRVMSLDRQKDSSVLVGLKASDNLTHGMIRTGMKLDAGTTFKAIHDAGLSPKETSVYFEFPVMETATGQESVAQVATYELRRSAARNINWKNADVIDWDAYRIMLDPVLQ